MKRAIRYILIFLISIIAFIGYSVISFTLPVYHYESSDKGFAEIEVPWQGRTLDIVEANFENYKRVNGKQGLRLYRTSIRIWRAPNLWIDNLTNRRWKIPYAAPSSDGNKSGTMVKGGASQEAIDYDEFLSINNAKVKNYLKKLSKTDIGTILKGVRLTDGKLILDGYRFIGEAKHMGTEAHIYIVEKKRQKAAFIWVDDNGSEIPLPNCPESISHESAYGITWEVYTWKAVQPGHGVVQAMCIDESWLKKIK